MSQRPKIPAHLQPFLEAASELCVNQQNEFPLRELFSRALQSLHAFPLQQQAQDLGELYQSVQERLVGQSARRSGQVFTPPAVCDFMVQLLEPKSGQSWCDPAVGLGAFGVALTSFWHCRAKGHRTKRAQTQKLPIDFQACDIDASAIALAQELLPQLGPFLKQDALCADADLPAGWLHGFDRVILNPPYSSGVTLHSTEQKKTRESLRERFSSASGSFDLYIPFMESALRLLKPGGRLAAILPVKWLAAPYGTALRELLLRESHLLQVHDLKALSVFRTASVSTMILLLEKKHTALETPVSAPVVRFTSLDSALKVRHEHEVSERELTQSASSGWGALLLPPHKRPQPSTVLQPFSTSYQVQASLTTDEFYRLKPLELCAEEVSTQVCLLTSGSIDPFQTLWGLKPSRFRKKTWDTPVVSLPTLSARRQKQVLSHRVLIANLSTRLEAVAVRPGQALGVVSVMQIFCKSLEESLTLSAWLNAKPVNQWVSAHFDVMRMNTQLNLTRALVQSIPAPPPRDLEPEFWRHLAHLASKLERLLPCEDSSQEAQAQRLMDELDERVAVWFHVDD
jgi:hypothetical protein